MIVFRIPGATFQANSLIVNASYTTASNLIAVYAERLGILTSKIFFIGYILNEESSRADFQLHCSGSSSFLFTIIITL